MSLPINIFIIYAREDKEVKQRLLVHLNPLRNAFNAVIWHDEFIEAGQEWKPHIESRLASTDLFILLVSSDFMNSEFIHQVEFKFAIDRHKEKRSVVVPVIVNYCQWDIDIYFKEYMFNLSQLQVLPDGGSPIGDWKTPDQAYNKIAAGIRTVLATINNKKDREQIELNKERERPELDPKHPNNSRKEVVAKPGKQDGLTEKDSKRLPLKTTFAYAIIFVSIAFLVTFFVFRNTSSEKNHPIDKQPEENIANNNPADTSKKDTSLHSIPNPIKDSVNNLHQTTKVINKKEQKRSSDSTRIKQWENNQLERIWDEINTDDSLRIRKSGRVDILISPGCECYSFAQKLQRYLDSKGCIPGAIITSNSDKFFYLQVKDVAYVWDKNSFEILLNYGPR